MVYSCRATRFVIVRNYVWTCITSGRLLRMPIGPPATSRSSLGCEDLQTLQSFSSRSIVLSKLDEWIFRVVGIEKVAIILSAGNEAASAVVEYIPASPSDTKGSLGCSLETRSRDGARPRGLSTRFDFCRHNKKSANDPRSESRTNAHEAQRPSAALAFCQRRPGRDGTQRGHRNSVPASRLPLSAFSHHPAFSALFHAYECRVVHRLRVSTIHHRSLLIPEFQL